ncbi:MAG TPA: endonuclease III, partial [Pseudomonadota bacterium]|nr:endonuclease III [Pseudomonadota bacterium]
MPTKRRPRASAQTLRVTQILDELDRLYPDAHCELVNWQSPLQLLVAVILSAQCTDERVNQVTPALFARYPDAAAFAAADPAELEGLIHSTGFYRNKAKHIREACKKIVEK